MNPTTPTRQNLRVFLIAAVIVIACYAFIASRSTPTENAAPIAREPLTGTINTTGTSAAAPTGTQPIEPPHNGKALVDGEEVPHDNPQGEWRYPETTVPMYVRALLTTRNGDSFSPNQASGTDQLEWLARTADVAALPTMNLDVDATGTTGRLRSMKIVSTTNDTMLVNATARLSTTYPTRPPKSKELNFLITLREDDGAWLVEAARLATKGRPHVHTHHGG